MTDIIDIEQLQARLRQFAKERDWEQFHNPKNISMALMVEAAELLEIFQWLTPEEATNINNQTKIAISHELADILLYLTRLADVLQINLHQAIEDKLVLNREKYPPPR